jgi:hypothetical protein
MAGASPARRVSVALTRSVIEGVPHTHTHRGWMRRLMDEQHRGAWRILSWGCGRRSSVVGRWSLRRDRVNAPVIGPALARWDVHPSGAG